MSIYKLILLLAITAVATLSSCVNADSVKVGQVENFSITKFTGSHIECKSSIEIDNQSIWPITLKNKEMLIYAGDQQLGTVNFSDVLKIKSKTKKVYDFSFSVEITNMELGFSSLVGNILGNKSEYRLKGNVSACSLLICKNIQINEVLAK